MRPGSCVRRPWGPSRRSWRRSRPARADPCDPFSCNSWAASNRITAALTAAWSASRPAAVRRRVSAVRGSTSSQDARLCGGGHGGLLWWCCCCSQSCRLSPLFVKACWWCGISCKPLGTVGRSARRVVCRSESTARQQAPRRRCRVGCRRTGRSCFNSEHVVADDSEAFLVVAV